MYAFREIVEGAIEHELEQIAIFTIKGKERPDLRSQFLRIKGALERDRVRVVERPYQRTNEVIRWRCTEYGRARFTGLELYADGVWKLVPSDFYKGQPSSHLMNLLRGSQEDLTRYSFTPDTLMPEAD
jgi:hypothetical protein